MRKKTKKALRSLVENVLLKESNEEDVLVVLNAIKTGELQVECMIQAIEKERQQRKEAKPGMLYALYPEILGDITVKKVVVIDERLLGLFLSGDTTPDETYAILKASKTNPNVALFLDVAEAAGFLGKKRIPKGRHQHKNRKK